MDLLIPDSGLLFWMVISFAVVFLILAKWGFPIITGMVNRRKEAIDKALTDAADARELLAHLKDQGEAIIAQAQDRQQEILKQGEILRRQIIEQADLTARGESEKILAAARLQIEREKEGAMQDLRSQVAVLSVAVAEKVLRKELDTPKNQAEWVNKVMDEAHLPEA